MGTQPITYWQTSSKLVPSEVVRSAGTRQHAARSPRPISVCESRDRRGRILVQSPPDTVAKETIYAADYPPQAARLDYLMKHCINWCAANRPHSESG